MSDAMTHRTALWAIPVSDLGGVARHVLDTARAGVPDTDVVFLVPPGPLVDALAVVGARVLEAPWGPAVGPVESARALRRAVRDVRPDVVHTHLSYADLVASAVVPRGVALVSTEHGIADDDRVYHGSWRRAVARAQMHHLRLRRLDALIAVSQATLTAVRRKWRPRPDLTTQVVLNGIDPVERSAPSAGLRIASLCRLAPEKRLHDLVTAFALIAREHHDAELTMAGTGPLADALQAQVGGLGIRDRVHFPGFVDPGTLLRRSDVVGQLSVWENCSYTLLDAAAHGLGVVASGVGGNPEVLPARCLVTADDPHSVARALVEQGTHPAARPGLRPGWPTVQEMVEQIGCVYDEVRP